MVFLSFKSLDFFIIRPSWNSLFAFGDPKEVSYVMRLPLQFNHFQHRQSKKVDTLDLIFLCIIEIETTLQFSCDVPYKWQTFLIKIIDDWVNVTRSFLFGNILYSTKIKKRILIQVWNSFYQLKYLLVQFSNSRNQCNIFLAVDLDFSGHFLLFVSFFTFHY